MDKDFTTVTDDEFFDGAAEKTCAICPEFVRCDFPGHESIGWCCCDEDFVEADWGGCSEWEL